MEQALSTSALSPQTPSTSPNVIGCSPLVSNIISFTSKFTGELLGDGRLPLTLDLRLLITSSPRRMRIMVEYSSVCFDPGCWWIEGRLLTLKEPARRPTSPRCKRMISSTNSFKVASCVNRTAAAFASPCCDCTIGSAEGVRTLPNKGLAGG
ncbi:hypothetical protein BDR26DRAFT_855141 [Obelidium mucronatum]|nr:hypothetical protein BDR26DRAFT_855141 [Obelidium mucronatum]